MTLRKIAGGGVVVLPLQYPVVDPARVISKNPGHMTHLRGVSVLHCNV